MKKLIVLFILSYALNATPIRSTMPLALQQKLCEQLASNTNRCENGSTLDYYKHLSLVNDQMLIFVYLNEHARTYAQTANAVALLIDTQGRWISTVGENIIAEDIQSITQDPYGGIWVRSLWQIEGVSPSYYHSTNGLKWKRTKLPQNRNVNCCFETVDDPIFLLNTLTLTFKDLEGKVKKSWAATYASAMSDKPLWQPLVKAPNGAINNIKPSIWSVKKSKNSISFFNHQNKKKIILPYEDRTQQSIYDIQVGAFKKKASVETVRSSLKDIPYPIFTKKTRGYTKLLIGEFTNYKKAQFILNQLKKSYPNNKNLQKAFVLKAKP